MVLTIIPLNMPDYCEHNWIIIISYKGNFCQTFQCERQFNRRKRNELRQTLRLNINSVFFFLISHAKSNIISVY